MEENRTLIIVDDEVETLKGYVAFLSPQSEAAPRRTSSRLGAAAPQVDKGGDRFRLLTASSGEEAVRIAQEELAAGRRIAGGFFDVKLEGGMDGLSTIRAIQALDRDIHCVVVTAYHDRTVDEIQGLFGEDLKDQWDYLNKPFTQGEIVQKARQMVGSWNRKRKLEAMNEQLIRSERMAGIGQVARGIGHEFGNILLRIMGKTDLALMEKSDIAKIHDHLQVVMRATERAAVIVRNLQTFAKSAPVFVSAQLSAPAEEALSLVSHELSRASVEVVKEFKPVPDARLDTGGIAQVFLNLFINATHAMQKGGKIHLTIEEASSPEGRRGVQARVKDTGSGIPPEVLPRIFEFAFTTKGNAGSGLGLSVSREILESHGGYLSVRSEPGRGAEFTLWVPLA